ncbi:MAG: chemotaxis protein CheW [Chloroflexi bacterium]|nr:chemotaxis protein CheW [Chloroflexota bacterium]
MSKSKDGVESVYLGFDVQDKRYAVDSSCVIEIIELEKISHVLDVSQFVEGTISLRDRVIPVMDSRVRLGLPQREQGVCPTIIVMEPNGVPTGLAVDRVMGAVSVRQETVTPPPCWHGVNRVAEDETASAVQFSTVERVDEHGDVVGIVLDVPYLLYAHGMRLNISQEVLMAAEKASAKKK